MSRLIIFCILLSAISFCAFLQGSKKEFQMYHQLSKNELRILDTISRLNEVRAKRSQMLNQFKGSRLVKPIIYRRPTDRLRYYWIKVVEDNGGVITTHFNFYVDEKTLEIRFFDPLKNEQMTLPKWRKGRGR